VALLQPALALEGGAPAVLASKLNEKPLNEPDARLFGNP